MFRYELKNVFFGGVCVYKKKVQTTEHVLTFDRKLKKIDTIEVVFFSLQKTKGPLVCSSYQLP